MQRVDNVPPVKVNVTLVAFGDELLAEVTNKTVFVRICFRRKTDIGRTFHVNLPICKCRLRR